MFVQELFENTSRHASFCFGRMNPPTLGHKELLRTVEANSEGGDYYIFASKTHKLPDNPLDYNTKFKFLQAMFPEYAEHMVYDPNLKTIIQVASWLYDKGYTEITFCAGSDRLPEFQKLLNTYNGKGQPGDKNYYIFSKINFESSGERDADAEGLAGISASKARAAAINNDFEDFKAKTGAGKLAKPLFNAVKKAMGVAEDIALDTASSISPIHGKPMEEDAAGVGVVATNKKMARDPRYSTSITKDVKPKTPKNMLRAFRLAENKKKSFDHQINENRQLELAVIPMIKKFLPIVKTELNLKKLPKIKVQRHVEVHDGQATFGRFVNNEQVIYIGVADRHPVDVIRTLAHELVHWKQFLDDKIEPNSGETGSPIENEAHAKAGVLLRIFNKKYPNAIKLDNIELNESIDFVSNNISYSDMLNPIAWDDDKLKPEVQDRLLKIAGEFIKYLEVPNFKIEDVVLTGSMANYNWTKYSDFDLHIITDYNHLECDDLAEILYRAKKDLWNSYHDITIGGHEVELYVEDIKDPPVSAGIFSILDNRWISKPKFDRPFIDKNAVNAKVNDLIKQINTTIKTADSEDDIQRLKDKIRKMRRAGLDKNGEFSVENLSFKILRNMGLLDNMSLKQKKIQDKKLSLEK